MWATSGHTIDKRMKTTEIIQSFYCLRRTAFGSVAVLWSVHREQPKIWRVVISQPSESAGQIVRIFFPGLRSSSCTAVDRVVDRIAAFLAGESIRFSLDNVRMDLCSPFQQKVLRAEHGIPRGRVSTYQRIARHLGNADAARAVGTALATNPFPIIIPCHRAIRSDGTLGGYQGGLQMKRALLKMEGVLFDSSGHAIAEKLYY
jgi:methylated-DNA-[protein]-cysteine S-methyltransferase